MVDKYLPDIVIVRKSYPKYRKRQRNRIWKLKHFEDQNMQGDDENNNEVDAEEPDQKKSKKNKKRSAKADKEVLKKGKDYELFLQDIEDDPEFRAGMNLYRNEDIIG